jgi:hypothetical protein
MTWTARDAWVFLAGIVFGEVWSMVLRWRAVR